MAVLAFAAVQGAGIPRGEDFVMLGAVVVSAVGYSEGAALAREMGGWRVISWALVLFAPLLIPFVLVAGTGDGSPGAGEWLGFAYVTVISAFAGFFAWYAGLARGGIARTSQIQLAQPLLTFLWSALFLGEIDLAAHLPRGPCGVGLRGGQPSRTGLSLGAPLVSASERSTRC